jgi:hypothetical protein
MFHANLLFDCILFNPILFIRTIKYTAKQKACLYAQKQASSNRLILRRFFEVQIMFIPQCAIGDPLARANEQFVAHSRRLCDRMGKMAVYHEAKGEAKHGKTEGRGIR